MVGQPHLVYGVKSLPLRERGRSPFASRLARFRGRESRASAPCCEMDGGGALGARRRSGDYRKAPITRPMTLGIQWSSAQPIATPTHTYFKTHSDAERELCLRQRLPLAAGRRRIGPRGEHPRSPGRSVMPRNSLLSATLLKPLGMRGCRHM